MDHENPIPFAAHQKRPKSLDEFERPPWPRLSFDQQQSRWTLFAFVCVGLIIGVALGLLFLA